MNIDQLQIQRQNTWHTMRSLLDQADREHRDLRADEQQSFDRMNAELDNLDQRLADLHQREQSERALANAFARVGGKVPSGTGVSGSDRDLDAAFRAAVLQNDRRPIEVVPAQRRSGFQPGIERRDLVTTNLTPTSFHDKIVAHMVDNAAILAAGATLLQTETGESLKVPKSTAMSTAAIVAEAGAIGESDPTITTASLGAYKYGFLVQVTSELAADASFDLLGYLAEMSGQAIANGFGAHAITGTGSSQPYGVITNATTGVTGGTGVAGAFTADNLIDLYHSVAEPYARSKSAAWLMRNATLGAVRKLKDSQSRYLFDVAVPPGSGASGTLLGRPVFCDPTVAAVALSAKSVAFGDLSKYWVRMAGPLRFERSDSYAFANDLVSFRALARLDGVLVDQSGAVKVFVGAGS